MIDSPKTLKEAKKIRYNKWAANPKGHPYVKGYCAYEVWTGVHSYQCNRKSGYGPENLYCKQHAKIVKKWG